MKGLEFIATKRRISVVFRQQLVVVTGAAGGCGPRARLACTKGLDRGWPMAG